MEERYTNGYYRVSLIIPSLLMLTGSNRGSQGSVESRIRHNDTICGSSSVVLGECALSHG